MKIVDWVLKQLKSLFLDAELIAFDYMIAEQMYMNTNYPTTPTTPDTPTPTEYVVTNYLAKLQALAPHARTDILEGLVQYHHILFLYDINTKQRFQMFLAQICHESDYFRTMREYASGAAYEGRADLGNTQPGDGVKFKGRGLIELTGRVNYSQIGKQLNIDLLNHPELAEQMPTALEVSTYFWQHHGCNELADAGDFQGITRRINGGLNGYADRQAILQHIKNLGF